MSVANDRAYAARCVGVGGGLANLVNARSGPVRARVHGFPRSSALVRDAPAPPDRGEANRTAGAALAGANPCEARSSDPRPLRAIVDVHEDLFMVQARDTVPNELLHS